MQRTIRLLPKEHFDSRMREAGYYLIRVRQQGCKEEWRKKLFHLIVKIGRSKITLDLHFDPSDHFTMPEIAHSRYFGEDLTKEMQRIMSICLRK